MRLTSENYSDDGSDLSSENFETTFNRSQRKRAKQQDKSLGDDYDSFSVIEKLLLPDSSREHQTRGNKSTLCLQSSNRKPGNKYELGSCDSQSDVEENEPDQGSDNEYSLVNEYNMRIKAVYTNRLKIKVLEALAYHCSMAQLKQ